MFNKSFLSLSDLTHWIENRNFSGFDPYDALNSDFILDKSKWIRILATTLFRFSPVNLRKIAGIGPGINAKAMGLLLSSYSKLNKFGIKKVDGRQSLIFEWLVKNRSKDFSGFSWGYNFPWQDVNRLLPRGAPSIVTTAYVTHGILDYYDSTKDPLALAASKEACEFILKDLNIKNISDSLCFSYTPFEKNMVHNANVLGSSILARVYSYSNSSRLKDNSTKSINFTVDRQNSNGSWDYGINPETQEPRIQIDWHQGFILDSLLDYIKYIEPSDPKYYDSLIKGAEYYKNNQFMGGGRCKWRGDTIWPVDVHNQAQAIITFTKLSEYNLKYLEFACKVADWTIDNLRDNSGFFYFQKWPLFTNKIPYMRWSQSWMMLALTLLNIKKIRYKNELS